MPNVCPYLCSVKINARHYALRVTRMFDFCLSNWRSPFAVRFRLFASNVT